MTTKDYQGRERRKSVRLNYPSNHFPRIKISGKAYIIIDISEIGIRFYNPNHQRVPDDLFPAHVTFQDGEQIRVMARVVRLEPLMVALELVEGIPYQRMLAEKNLIEKPIQE